MKFNWWYTSMTDHLMPFQIIKIQIVHHSQCSLNSHIIVFTGRQHEYNKEGKYQICSEFWYV